MVQGPWGARRQHRLHQALGVRPGDEHPLPHPEGVAVKRPAAQQVLQRFPLGAAGKEGPHPPDRGRGQLVTQVQGQLAPGKARPVAEELGRVELGGLHPPLPQQGLPLPPEGADRAGLYHRSSSPFWGMTASMAATATSIIESSGSLTVRRCSQRPGAERTLVRRLSCPPAYLMIS